MNWPKKPWMNLLVDWPSRKDFFTALYIPASLIWIVFAQSIPWLWLHRFLIFAFTVPALYLRPGKPPFVLIIPGIFLLLMLDPVVFFSDDQLRHLFDGWLFRQGLDPYTISPVDVNVSGAPDLPNHPQFSTIYLPFTQVQAWIGFRPIYTMVTFFLVLFTKRRWLFQYPFFWIVLASGHGDLQGMLLVLLAVEQWRRNRNAYFPFLPVALAALIKPEALLFVLYPLLHCRLSLRTLFLVSTVPVSVFLGFYVLFSLLNDGRSLLGFIEVVWLFDTYFVSYRPDLIYAIEKMGMSAEQAIRTMRTNWLPFYLLGAGLTGLRFRERIIRLVGAKDLLVLFVVLVLYFLYRGTWQPWYFLWFFPLLRRRYAAILIAFLPLLYLPVVEYRMGQAFQYSFLYGTVLLLSLFYLTQGLFIRTFRQ